MEFYLVLVIIWTLTVIASGALNVRRRKNNLNLVAFCIYCVGFTWASAEFLSVLLMSGGIYGEARLIFSWLPAAGIVGFLAWRWWTANHAVAAAPAGGVAIGPTLSEEVPAPILRMSERAVALIWFGASIVVWFPMVLVFGENNWNLIRDITGAYCGDSSYYRTVCYADEESGAVFGAFVAFVTGSVLFYRRRGLLGTAERWVYGVGIALSVLTMVLFWMVGIGAI